MNVIDILDISEHIVVERWLRSFDTIEATVDAQYAKNIARGDFLYLPLLDASAPLAFRVTAIQRDKKGGANKWVLHGVTLDRIALGGRRCWPSPADYPVDTAGYDTQSSVPGETAVKHYVDDNAGPSAVAARQVTGLRIADDLGRGADVDTAARYQWVVDVSKEICFKTALGWKVSYEAGTELPHVFDIIEPVDRSAEVFLDFEWATINAWSEVETDPDATLTIVAGQGELTDRDIVIRPAIEPTGLDRIEDFIDARDVASGETALLEQRGDAALAAAAATRSITVDARQEGSFQYPTDYALGDYITARDRDRDLSEVKQVIGVRFTVDKSASVPKVDAILDRPDPDSEPRASTSFSGGKVDLSAGSSGGGGGSGNLDGGTASSVYGGTTAIDGGSA